MMYPFLGLWGSFGLLVGCEGATVDWRIGMDYTAVCDYIHVMLVPWYNASGGEHEQRW
jgi:hypothetical protein